MNDLDYWRLCDELTVAQAALLIVGESATNSEQVETRLKDAPEGYEAAKTAICIGLRNFHKFDELFNKYQAQQHAIEEEYTEQIASFVSEDDMMELQKRSIEGTLVPHAEYDLNRNFIEFIEGTVDAMESTVNSDSLKQWLSRKGIRAGFFFPEPVTTLDFLDPNNPRYAPKLAAAVKAWQAVTDPGKKSAKQALDKWLREHAVEFGLTNEDGKIIETAIEECSKVANWNTKGGATKTLT